MVLQDSGKALVALLHAFAVEEFADVTAGEGLCEDEAAGADGAFGEHAREEDAAEGLELLAQAAAGMVVAHVGLIDVVGHHAEGGEEEPLLVAVDLVDHGARAARAFDDAGEGRALVAVLDENVDGAAKELDRTVAASEGFSEVCRSCLVAGPGRRIPVESVEGRIPCIVPERRHAGMAARFGMPQKWCDPHRPSERPHAPASSRPPMRTAFLSKRTAASSTTSH